MSKPLILPALVSTAFLLPASGQELAPDDPSIAASLGAWFRDAANTFDTETGIWADSSGNGRHAVPVGEVDVNGPITYLPPTLTTISGGAFSDDEVPSVHFASDAEDLLACEGINAGTNLSELTIIVACNVDPLGSNASLARPVGIGSVAALQFNAGNNFNLGSDPSIRKDNGSLGSGLYSLAFPIQTTLIRSARMSPSAIDEWFNITGTAEKAINLPGVSYTTSSDDFFLGDLRAGVEPIPGVNGTGTSQADLDIIQALVYTSALSDVQIAGINEWLSNQIVGGGGGAILEFTDVSVSADGRGATLTWRSKPGRTYAVDLSYDLRSAWQELNDGVPSQGGETTTTTVPTFLGPEPAPLPGRVFYRVREVN